MKEQNAQGSNAGLDLNFAIVGNILSKNAKRLFEDYEERHQAKTVTQIKDFVGKLGGLQSEHQSLRLRELQYSRSEFRLFKYFS